MSPLLVPLLALALLSTGCSIDVLDDAVESREEKIFTVSGPVTLAVTTFDGSIEVASWDRNEVRVEILRRASSEQQLADLVVDTRQEGGRIVVDAREPRRRNDAFGNGASVSFLVTAPRTSALEARTGDGSVSARDLSGGVRVDTGDGSIRLDRTTGDLRLRTGDGSVEVTEARGAVDVETGDGSVEVSGVLAQLRVRTGDGAVSATADTGSVMQADWQIETGDGAISLRLPSAFDAEVEAGSGDGSIHVDGISTSTDRDESRKAVRGRLGRGGHGLRLQSGDGPIDVSVR
jgi:DUF4097 and DUF4098 domain-containing protein YvlB